MGYRIQKAAELLKDPSEKVTHAASAVGFNDLSDFARIFKLYLGITPSKYRRQQKDLKIFPDIYNLRVNFKT